MNQALSSFVSELEGCAGDYDMGRRSILVVMQTERVSCACNRLDSEGAEVDSAQTVRCHP